MITEIYKALAVTGDSVSEKDQLVYLYWPVYTHILSNRNAR